MIQREENVDYYGIGDKKLVIFSPICCQWNGIIDIEEKFKRYIYYEVCSSNEIET